MMSSPNGLASGLRPGRRSRAGSLAVLITLGMVALPAALTLHRVRVSPVVDLAAQSEVSPYGYTVSLLLFIVPIGVIGLWLLPREDVRISRRAFLWTIGVLFPIGALMDFFFARSFFTFPNPGATLRITAPALGGGVPVEEYAFYLFGFVADLLLYIWLDEYWLSAYTVPVGDARRTGFDRLLRFHPASALWAGALLAAGIAWKHAVLHQPGLPGYLIFLTVTALGPSALLFPAARPVINWRAFSMTLFLMLLISLLWEVTLGLPYGWWGFRHEAMVGVFITAWSGLPVEEVLVWVSVAYATVIVYEILRRWKASGRSARHAFLG